MKRVSTALFVLLFVLIVAYGFILLLNRPRVDRVQAIAHRGGDRIEPENTLAAFRLAAEEGVDWLEFDVQMTSDGELVVIHDTTLDRTTDGAGTIAESTFDEIRALDAGDGEPVPTLAEVIAVAKEFEVGVMPEIKAPHLYPGIEEKVVAEIVEADYLERAVVQSFDRESLAAVNRLQPELELCLLTGTEVWNFPQDMPDGPYSLCPMAEVAILNPLLIYRAHADARNVYIWFGLAENPLTVRLVQAHGADGIMADDHRMLLGLH